jgi:hypothetical protein
MPFPAGLPTKTMTFGRYSSALGTNRSGQVRIGFDQPMLHVPTGEVITSGLDVISIGGETGATSVTVPVTVTEDLVANWLSVSPVYNQRLRVEIVVTGYPPVVHYVDIDPSDPSVIDFDHLAPYAVPGGLSVLRATVSSVAGEAGDITAEALRVAASTHYVPLASSLASPPAGQGALFFDTADSKLKIRLPDGSMLASPAWTVWEV